MKKLCIFFGGASTEHDISIITAMQLFKNIKSRYEVELIYIGLDNEFYLATHVSDIAEFKDKDNLNLKKVYVIKDSIYTKHIFLKKLCDIFVAINCCHGGVGENGDLAGFFAVNGIHHTSCDSLSAHICMNKSLTKTLLRDIVPTIKGTLINKNNYEEKISEIKANFKDDLIVKPNALGSSIGVKACNKTDFTEQIDAIFELNDDALVEERVVNMLEYNQACYRTKNGLVVSAIENPIKNDNILTFEEKYMHSKAGKQRDRIIPAKISDELKSKIDDYTRAIYERLNLNGVVRIDYIFDKDCDTLYLNEVNTIPGSLAFYLYEDVGIDYITLVDELIENALKPKKFSYFNSSVLSNKLL